MWYCRYEIQVRQAIFFSAASIAGAFSGLLAYGISYMDGVAGLAGWRWIFILEGILTVVVAVIAFFALYDFPETASFLTAEERAFVAYRLKYDGQDGGTTDGHRVAQNDSRDWKYVRAAFLDWQIWVNIVVYWGYVCPLCESLPAASHIDRDSLTSPQTASRSSSRPSSNNLEASLSNTNTRCVVLQLTV